MLLRARDSVVLWLTAGLALAFTAWTGVVIGGLPNLPGRLNEDRATVLISVLADVIARVAGLATVGGLAALALRPAAAASALAGIRSWVGRLAQIWFAAALLLTFANAAFVNGVPLAWAAAQWWTFVSATPSTLAWALAAGAALAAAVGAYVSARPAFFALAWLAGVLAQVFVAATGIVTVGADHDWATDGAVLASLALSLLASAAVTGMFGRGERPVRPWRILGLLTALTAGLGVVAWQSLAGQPVGATLFGVPVLGAAACLATLWLSWAWRMLTGRGWEAFNAALLIGLAAFLTAAEHVPPPRFSIAQSAQINYLGYELPNPATIARLLSWGRPNLLWLVLTLLAVGAYAWGVFRVLRAGGHWPIGRLLAWLASWVIVGFIASSGLWEYSTAVFSWHMLVHMTVNMLVPILAVLGAPFTLIAEASSRRSPGASSIPRQLLTALASYRPVRWLLSPPVLWVIYVGSLFAVYFTPAFAWLMHYHWAHQLMLLHFMVAGYAFFSLVVGIDKTPWPMPPLVKFALLLSIMPFHAIFAVGIMMNKDLIGAGFYRAIDVAWNPDLMATQNVAGQITWFTGEVPMFVAVVALAAQWFRQDNREAVSMDSMADAGVDDSLEAYNELLARLAERDRARPDGGRGERP